MLTRNHPIKIFVSGLLVLTCLQTLPTVAAPFSAVLPSSRSVEIGVTATAFATILNVDNVVAEGCSIAPSTAVDASFFYQTTDPLSNALTGTPDTPVDIPAGGSQSFVIGMTPNSDFAADVVAVAVTPGGGGIASLPRDGIFGLMSLATTNVGAQATITARPVDLAGLDGFLRICQTDSNTSECLEPLTEESTAVLAADETRTYSVFIASNTRILLDATNRRTAVEFVDEFGNVRGSTSVAIEGGGPSALTFFTDNVADQILQNNCTVCHVQGGEAQDTALVFQIDEVMGYQQNNFTVVAEYLNSSPDNADMILNLATGMGGHPQIVEEDSTAIAVLLEFFELFATE